MEDKTLLLQFLGENPTLKIIDFFLDNRTDYSKKGNNRSYRNVKNNLL